MVLWTIAIIMTIIFLFLLLLIWLRKVQFDAIHQNFLDLEDQLGGEVVRGGFAVRPRFKGEYNGKPFAISISSEGSREERRYYISVTMRAKSRYSFTVMDADWLGKRANDTGKERDLQPLLEGKYILELARNTRLGKKDLALIEKVIQPLAPFAYILVGGSSLMMERISHNIIEDTKIAHTPPLLAAMAAMAEQLG